MPSTSHPWNPWPPRSSIWEYPGKVSDKVAGLIEPALKIDFLPDFSERELAQIIAERVKKGYFPSEDLLNGLVHKKLGETIVGKHSVIPEELAFKVKNYRLKVSGVMGFDNAQVTKGGVDGEDVSSATYQSLLVKNLYITGEMLDVDGECGGYNLTFAFASGIIAARDIKFREKE